jgi:hypothetical protein
VDPVPAKGMKFGWKVFYNDKKKNLQKYVLKPRAEIRVGIFFIENNFEMKYLDCHVGFVSEFWFVLHCAGMVSRDILVVRGQDPELAAAALKGKYFGSPAEELGQNRPTFILKQVLRK